MRAKRLVRSLLVVVAATVGALCLGVAPVSAHASLSSSDPVADTVIDTAPAEVVLTFDAPVSLDLGGGIRVFGPGGERVDRGKSSLADGETKVAVPIDDGGIGTYTVAWKAVSGDSHVLTGSFVFHVQQQTGAAGVGAADRPGLDALSWFARWLIVISAAALGGIAVFRLASLTKGDELDPRTRLVMILLSGVGVFGASLKMLVQVAESSGRSLAGAAGLLGEAASTTRTGSLDAWRVAVFVGLLGAAIIWRHLVAAVMVVSGVIVVGAINAFSGHAWTADHRGIALVADVAHQVAGAVWVGGLLALLLVLRRQPEEPHWFVRRFSSMALIAVAAIAVTGGFAGWEQLGSLSAVGETSYGRTLLVKVAVVAVMIALGWWNRAGLRQGVERLVRVVPNVRVEAMMGLGVLALTAALVGMVPGREATVSPAVPYTNIFRHGTGTGTVSVTLKPARVGANSLDLYFFEANGALRPVDVAAVTVASGDVPERRIDMVPLAPGHFSAFSFSLPSPGLWRFKVSSITRGVPAESEFEVTIT